MKKYIKSNLHIIAPMVLLLAAVISSVIIYSVRTEQYKDWRPISGYVTGVDDLRKFKTRIRYTYMVKGIDYDSYDIFYDRYMDVYPNAGNSVTVWYDPDKPELASYYEPTPGLDPYAPFFVTLPLSVAVYFSLARRKQIGG